jgi:hypothetical protein
VASEPTVTATRYEVTCYPYDDINRSSLEVTVEYRGRGKWAVLLRTRCLGADGEWDWERLPSERADDWLAEHRFELDDALRRAKEIAPTLTLNGSTIDEVVALEDRRRAEEASRG